jgi:ADP-ribose pyrophosphatase YjhB (NUDIX family)
MKFCSLCGAMVVLRVPEGDQHPRHVCTVCGNIHYQNPKLVVGTLPVWENKVLLCRRAIEPRRGYWTLPSGFMEIGESTSEGALRETQEEACARVELIGLYTLINIPHISQVHLLYHARLLNLDFAPGEESLETRLFDEQNIPWSELAFRSVSVSLRHYFSDRTLGLFPFREETLG